MNGMHAAATAATVLGSTGVVSMVAYRAALRHVDVDLLPGRIMPRAVWWRDHVGRVLCTSLLLVFAGLTVLVSG
ncbi:MAG TPA: hypothetical protein VHV74_26970 [Pseudonocardiaceae bacterium]|jgi:hypothetical protein|nr:hypothetical protein [Pseudonocardiaceae bacterium]